MRVVTVSPVLKKATRLMAVTVVLAAALLLVRNWPGGGPQHLRDFRGKVLGVGSGMLVRVELSATGENTLYVEAVETGKVRLRKTLQLPDAEMCGGAIAGGEVFYLLRRTLRDARWKPGTAILSRDVNYRYTLHRIAMDGRPLGSREFEGPYPVLLTADACFWWAPDRGGMARLMAVRHTDEVPETLLRGRVGALAETPEAVFATLPIDLEGVTPSDLVTLDRSTGDIELYPKFFPPGTVSIAVDRGIAYLGGRVYWSEPVPRSVSGDGTEGMRQVVTARADGSDRRILIGGKSTAPHFHMPTVVGTHRGRLLLASTVQSESSSGTTGSLTPVVLVAIDPAHPEEPQHVFRTNLGWKSRFYVDQGSVYIANFVRRENWLDWSASGLQAKEVNAWHRLRLPD